MPRPPRSTLTATLFPSTTLFRSTGRVRFTEFAEVRGWSLTEAGRVENERQLGAELDHAGARDAVTRSEEHTSELQSLMRNSYAVFCLKQKNKIKSIIEKT